MKKIAILVSLTAVLLAPSMIYAADECSVIMHEFPSFPSVDFEGCVCDSRPKNLRRNHSPDFRIVGACNLRWKPGMLINPDKQQFPPENKNPIYGYGAIYMLGEATLEGKLRSDAMGRIFLNLYKPLLLGDVVYKVSSLEVGSPPKNILVIPKHLRHLSCLDGSAKVKVKNLFVMFTDITSVEVSAVTSIYQNATLDKLCAD